MGGGAGDGPCWVQLDSPVFPDDVIISSGAFLIRRDDRGQLFLGFFLMQIVFGFPLLYEKLLYKCTVLPRILMLAIIW